jgi:hypothetical protein
MGRAALTACTLIRVRHLAGIARQGRLTMSLARSLGGMTGRRPDARSLNRLASPGTPSGPRHYAGALNGAVPGTFSGHRLCS